MGLRELLGGRTHGLISNAISLPITSPYSPSPQMPGFVVEDILGADEVTNLPLDRGHAITIPSVSKARNLLVSSIAGKPLRAIRTNTDGSETDVTRENAWLYRTNSSVSPYERMAWTVDDLIFYGVSLWLVDRGAPAGNDQRRPILNAEWCPTGTWEIQNVKGEFKIVVDGVPIAEDRYVLINSPFEGLLTIGQRTLRGARDTEDAWVGRARNPIPVIDLHRTDDDEVTDDELKKYVDAWAAARTGKNGAIGSTPANIDLRVLGEVKAELMVEGRNAIRTDVGSHMNIRASMLDGTTGVDSLTYTTKDGEKNAFYEFDLPFWIDPIAARLSLDDLVPRGTRIRFDMYEAYNQPTPTGPTVED